MVTNIILGIIAFLLLVFVIQFGVLLQRHDAFDNGCKLSSINSKAQSMVDELNQINGKIDGFIPVTRHFKETLESIYNAIGADGCLTTKLLKEVVEQLDVIKSNTMMTVHTPSVWGVHKESVYPSFDKAGITADGICVDCGSKGTCPFYDPNATRCSVCNSATTEDK